MKVDDFDFDLPQRLIAERPARPRDSARLLVLPADSGPLDHVVGELPDLLAPGDILVCNDTKVIPARLFGIRRRAATSAKIAVTLLKSLGRGSWSALARPARRLRPGDEIAFASDFVASVEQVAGGEVVLRFTLAGAALTAAIARHGTMPLPPYILAKRPADALDATDYQTIFAARDGAVAAPTAGLHFTPELMARLAARGIAQVAITLHVGAGTFLPIKAADTDGHRLHAEWGEVGAATADAINAARAKGGRIVAVGTTAMRLLETAANAEGRIAPFAGETDLFITPGYRFKAVEIALTNFHLPRSTLFMLAAAFVGLARLRAAYEHAIARDYRFYSFGDACLLFRGAS